MESKIDSLHSLSRQSEIKRVSMLTDQKATYLEPELNDGDVTLAELLHEPIVKTNLIIFICAWTVTTFSNFLLQFLVNTYELVYISALGLSIADLIGFLFGSLLFFNFGLKGALYICYGLTAIGGLSLMFYGIHHQESPLFPLLIIIAKFGIGCSI